MKHVQGQDYDVIWIQILSFNFEDNLQYYMEDTLLQVPSISQDLVLILLALSHAEMLS